MFRLNPLTKQFKSSLIRVQQRSIVFDVEKAFPSDRRPPNMADFRVRAQESSKSDLFKHELRGRRNTESVDSLWNQVKASYEKTEPYRFNDKDVEFVNEYFGFSEEEIRIAQDFKEYERVMFVEEEGEQLPNFDKLKSYWGSGSDSMVGAIQEFEFAFKSSLRRLNRYSNASNRLSKEEIRKRIRDFDFSPYEGRIPTRILNQIKDQHAKLCARYEPDLDAREMFGILGKEIDRGLVDFVDTLGEMKGFMLDYSTQQITHLGPAFVQDAEGNYVNDFDSFDFIETFFPEVRDLMLREMSVENYRLEFPWETKKYALGYEDIIQTFHRHSLIERRKEGDQKNITVVSSDKHAQEVARQLQHVSELLDEASALNREAGAKKAEEGPKEKAAEASAEAAAAEAASEEVDDLVWAAIEEQAGLTKEDIFGGRQSNYEPVDINAMLDAEEKKN